MAASKFTAENRGALLERVGAGLSLRDACRALGMREGTVKGWLTRGRREDEGAYSEFADAVAAARRAAAARPEPMTEDELRRIVSETARRGSVQAQKLYYQMLREAADEDDGLDEFDLIGA